MISPAQCRAARALLQWSQDDLSIKANVAKRTIASFEQDTRGRLQDRIEAALEGALDAAGIELIEQNGGGDGARFKRPMPRFMRFFRKTDIDYRGWVAFVFNYKGANRSGFVRYDALGIVEGDGLDPVEEFDKRLSRILMVAASKWDAGDVVPGPNVLISAGELDL
jgi:transcriptional regulator with XRE-family HTH domain